MTAGSASGNGQEAFEILVVEDDTSLRGVLAGALEGPGRRTVPAGSLREARAYLADGGKPGVVILDLGLPDGSGVGLVPELKEGDPACAVVVLTGTVGEEAVVEAMRLGATEYLTKPFALDALGALVDRSVRRYAEDRHTMAEGTPVAPTFSGHLVGKSPAMVELFKMVGKLAMSDIPVLVIGESGSGKELAARALHMYGRYSAGAFIPVDCAGIPASLLESELFGYERGAFTDAREAKPGRFEAADGGTLFLDEVGNIPLEVQSKLLRAVQDRATQRLGSNRAVPWRARIVCATNSNLRRMAGEGRFREDLFYRIAGAELVIPPLRERREDIPLLAVYFLGRISGNGRRFSAGAMEALAAHDWPGNVRELEHTVGRAAAVANGPVIGTDDLPAEVLGGVRYGDSGIAATPASIYPMAEMKRRHARECLRICGGDRKKAARMLGIHVKTLDSLTRVQGGGAGADGEAGRGLAQR